MLSLDRYLLHRFLPRVLSCACPSTVPRSGEAGQQVDCFTTTVWQGDHRELVLLGIRGRSIDCLRFDGEHCSIETVVSLEEIDPNELHVTHFLGLDEVRYVGVRPLAWGLISRWPYAGIHLGRARNAVAQWFFNRRSLKARHLDVLREVVDATAEGAESVDAMDLMSRRYGYRWAGHPNWKAHHRLLGRHLEMLAESGDLVRRDHSYRPSGHALKTLDDRKKADGKHIVNLTVQLLIVALTLASAFFAAVQANLLRLPTFLDLRDNASVGSGGAQAEVSKASAGASTPTTGR